MALTQAEIKHYEDLADRRQADQWKTFSKNVFSELPAYSGKGNFSEHFQDVRFTSVSFEKVEFLCLFGRPRKQKVKKRTTSHIDGRPRLTGVAKSSLMHSARADFIDNKNHRAKQQREMRREKRKQKRA